MIPTNHLIVDQFPRSNAYHPDWVVANASGGANSLWLTDWLTSALELKSGMNVLDLGCGCACSSIFLAREYDVTARFVKPSGLIAIAGAGLNHEIEDSLPDHLQQWWASEPSMWSLHSPAWWRRHWERTGIVDVLIADTMADGWQLWLQWHRTIAPNNLIEINAVQSDSGTHLGYQRVVGRRLPNVHLDEPIVSLPSSFCQKPLLCSRQ